MWTDDYKHITYMTLHFIDGKYKLWSNVPFTCEFPDDRKIACTIRREFSHKILKLGLKPDVLSKLIFVSDQGDNIVYNLQQCIRLNCCCGIINKIL
jgi:hypothetical protein